MKTRVPDIFRGLICKGLTLLTDRQSGFFWLYVLPSTELMVVQDICLLADIPFQNRRDRKVGLSIQMLCFACNNNNNNNNNDATFWFSIWEKACLAFFFFFFFVIMKMGSMQHEFEISAY